MIFLSGCSNNEDINNKEEIRQAVNIDGYKVSIQDMAFVDKYLVYKHDIESTDGKPIDINELPLFIKPEFEQGVIETGGGRRFDNKYIEEDKIATYGFSIIEEYPSDTLHMNFNITYQGEEKNTPTISIPKQESSDSYQIANIDKGIQVDGGEIYFDSILFTQDHVLIFHEIKGGNLLANKPYSVIALSENGDRLDLDLISGLYNDRKKAWVINSYVRKEDLKDYKSLNLKIMQETDDISEVLDTEVIVDIPDMY